MLLPVCVEKERKRDQKDWRDRKFVCVFTNEVYLCVFLQCSCICQYNIATERSQSFVTVFLEIPSVFEHILGKPR